MKFNNYVLISAIEGDSLHIIFAERVSVNDRRIQVSETLATPILKMLAPPPRRSWQGIGWLFCGLNQPNIATDGLSLNSICFLAVTILCWRIFFAIEQWSFISDGQVAKIPAANKVSPAPAAHTKALADIVFVADPVAGKQTVPIKGEAPSPFNQPVGCVFRTRCPHARDLCREDQPSLPQVSEDEHVACHFALHEWALSADK
jgi:oligopeptide/dipeptide ABC transporter ATP-binding protein